MNPATDSTKLSTPNPMRAIEEAAMPAARAIANSMKCHPIPPQGEQLCPMHEGAPVRGRKDEGVSSRSGAFDHQPSAAKNTRLTRIG